MSESSIALFVKFDDYDKFGEVEDILKDADNYISKSDEEVNFYDYLIKFDKSMGTNFDSWWIPDVIKTNGSAFLIKMIGSPSGTREQDIVTWFKKMGASLVIGNMVVDGGGDVEQIDI